MQEVMKPVLDFLRPVLPARFRADIPVVPVVRLSGAIGVATPLRPGLMLSSLARSLDHLTLVGRLDPVPGRLPYAVPDAVSFVALAHYSSLARPWSASKAMACSACCATAPSSAPSA